MFVIVFFIFYLLDRGDCTECGDREGFWCWLLVLFLFIGLLLGLLALLLATLFGYCNKKKTIYEE